MSTTRLSFLATAVLIITVLSGAQAATVTINGQANGPTPFIKHLNLTVSDAAALAHVEFKVYSKPGSDTRPVNVRYSKTYLENRGLLNPLTGEITLPVFALYDNYNNRVALVSTFTDQTSQRDDLNMQTPEWIDTLNRHKNPNVQLARVPNTNLSYDFVMLANFQTTLNTPIIIDTDGQVRWVGTGGARSHAAILFDNGIYIFKNASASTVNVVRMELDGTFSVLGNHNYRDDGVTEFHHTFDYGKTGILVQPDTEAVPALGTDAQIESVIFEIDASNGAILGRWDFADIFRAAITAAGEDPTLPAPGFVYTRTASPNDWFHINAAYYRRSDDTIIASSRENFVVAVDYTTKEIKWLFGDPTKKWYVNYPLSLRPKALTLAPGTAPPIGQHSVSIVRDRLLLFDNGTASLNHTPTGASHTNAIQRKYLIDVPSLTATEIWTYSANPPIVSGLQSSIYEDASRNYVINYSTNPDLIGLDSSGNKVFHYRYMGGFATIFNARPIHFEYMEFD